MMAMNDILLSVENLTMRFGGLLAIDDFSFAARRGEITAVIGPNGAGKTTAFNCLTGFYRPTSGQIKMHRDDGRTLRLDRLQEHQIAEKGRISRTFQNIRLFGGMTVLENLMVAQHNVLMRASLYTLGGILGLRSFARAEAKAVDKARYWLDRIGLLERADEPAASLPYGDQRRLEITRAMCTDPVLLCLDEPAAGLNARESHGLNELLLFVRDKHSTSLLLIEHDMSVVMEISDHVVVLDYGQKIAEGTTREVQNNPKVIAAYLGEDDLEEAEVAVQGQP